MAIITEKLDIHSLRGLTLVKILQITELSSGSIIPHNTTGKVLHLRVYDREDPINLLFQLSPTAQGIGYASFTFSTLQTNTPDLLDYYLVEEDTPNPEILVKYGTVSFLPLANYVSFSEMVNNEVPGGLTIPDSFISIKSLEWRLFLQKSINPPIADPDITNEQAWPILVNFLIAKLVVYDYLVKSIKSLLARTSSTDERNSSSIKKIETGPSNVEYFDVFNSLSDFLRPDKNGNTSLTTIAQDICQLAKRLSIYLPLCNNPDTQAIIPLKAGRVIVTDPTPILLNTKLL